MPSRSVIKTAKKQKGLALLVLVIVIMMAFAAYTLSGLSIYQVRSDQIKQTRVALEKAKQALIAYAVTYGDLDGADAGADADFPGEYGFLPCPDVDAGGVSAEGGRHSVCGAANVNSMGLFPWTSLETGVLNSASGDCLWYAVSGEYKDAAGTLTSMLNEDTNGSIILRDSSGTAIPSMNPEDRVVAVVINPSLPLAAQNRNFNDGSTCGLDYSAAEYLEGDGVYDNATLSGGAFDVDDFINVGIGTDELATPFNDQVVTITREELWGAVNKNVNSKLTRLTEALAMCVAAYGNNTYNRRLPRPGSVDFAGGDYRDNSLYNDTSLASYLGRYPQTVNDSDTAMGTHLEPSPPGPPSSVANAPVPGTTTLFDKGFCDALTVTDGTVVNLNTGSNEEGYMLWKNWKDHLFYAVSSYYAPTDAADTGVPGCDGTNCVNVNGTEYAAVVMYSGSRVSGLTRNEPIADGIAEDDKKNINNYLEVTNPIGDGTGNYTPTGNDVVFCITDSNPLSVVACP